MNQNKQEVRVVNIRDILYVLRKKIILLLVVVVLVTLAGVLYSTTQKPRYTASELVFLKAVNEDQISPNVTDNVSAMISYVETVVDFCDEGVVVDRANYHYAEYLKMKANGEVDDVESYIEWSKSVKNKNNYQGQEVDVVYFNKGDIKTSLGEKTITGNRPFNFSVKYTDDFSDIAKEKVRILVHALDLECERFDENSERKYFYAVEIIIEDEGLQAITTNVSRNKTILLFFALGLVLGVVVVYVSNALDNTVKTKVELEYLTGVGTMSIIEYIGGEK